jgi:hypothetical protein
MLRTHFALYAEPPPILWSLETLSKYFHLASQSCGSGSSTLSPSRPKSLEIGGAHLDSVQLECVRHVRPAASDLATKPQLLSNECQLLDLSGIKSILDKTYQTIISR